ncbi:MAG: glycosyltransferase, partial [bacterium]
MKGRKGLIIIPAFNEQENVGRVIREIQDCHSSLDIVVINDGSSDTTEEVAKSKGIPVVSLAFNLG